ncbi:MAG: ATP-dependent metallopeptidase FtsH/Yme1/Tma family protein, partial [Candidatus Dormiibacterota bacterium]
MADDPRRRQGQSPTNGSPGPGRPGGQPTPRNPFRSWRFWIGLAVLLVLNYVIATTLFQQSAPTQVTITYNQFLQQVKDNNVQQVTSTGQSIVGTTKKKVADASNGSEKSTDFITQRPAFANDDLEGLLMQHGVTMSATNPNATTPLWETLLFSFGPALLLIVGFIYLSRRMAGGGAGGVLGAFGQSRARLY